MFKTWLFKNKKGFSLVELLIAVAILAVLTAVLVPALHTTLISSREKSDQAAIRSLAATVQTAAQHNSVYKNAKKVADNSIDGKITVVYVVGQNNILTMDHCEIKEKDGSTLTDFNSSELTTFKNKIDSYVQGQVEQVELLSNKYLGLKYKFVLTFPDVDFKVNLSTETAPAK